MGNNGIIHEATTKQRLLAMTFDDGPDETYTPQLLQVLAAHGAKATFYMIGSSIEAYPDVARAVHSQGHEIGNHTYNHPYLTKIAHAERKEQLERTHALIIEITGSSPATFRPPYIDYNDEVAAEAAAMDYQMIGAVNMEAMDWAAPGVDHIVSKTMEQVRNGGILIFHDGYGDRSQTVEAVKQLVPELMHQGYRFVTVSELLKTAEPV
ncbi:polysaccharide deacetylase family protein [Paenibacillus harenae]|uniref:polysaccharide deacetylase family protein n=1 Tax=Paenibacillus harenae TaxID=306543 RepID=UPI002794D601|nr:polysaccharide deacetylase family protein [Paenibacillus harenae]MDQ0059348.1 peptidoglycan/xylan/chitin deacetylase (PgdA/CDA1 family) [Paenibacillus harenae]